MKQTILGLDQADKTGWAVYDGAYHSGYWKLKGKSVGDRLLEMHRRLSDLHVRFGFELVAYEIPVFRGRMERPKVLRHLHHIEAIVLMFCKAVGIAEPVGFAPDEWRKSVLGSGRVRAPKSCTTEADRKQWHEDNARFLCKTLGLDIKDGNEAEAVGILKAYMARLRLDELVA